MIDTVVKRTDISRARTPLHLPATCSQEHVNRDKTLSRATATRQRSAPNRPYRNQATLAQTASPAISVASMGTVRLNHRQEQFVLEYLKQHKPGKRPRASLAYMLAGYETTTRNALDVNASRLLNSAKVQQAIRQKRAAMLKRSDITIEKLLSDADAARELAMRIDQPAAATSAVQLQAKLVGLLVDRKETGAPGDFAGLTTPDQVIEAIRLELGEAAANALKTLLNPASVTVTPSEPAQAIEPTSEGSGAIN